MVAWLLLIGLAGCCLKREDAFNAFADGAKRGLQTAVSILPFLAATMTAINAMNASGLIDGLCAWAAPAASVLGLPDGALPLVVLRPFSGAASLAMLQDIMRRFGPDSRASLVAGAMMGSGETVFYTCALYLSAAGVKKSRYIIPVSLFAWLCGCATAGLFFR